MTKAFELRFFAITLFFYQNEGPRPHIHVRHRDGRELKVWLDDYTIARSGFKLHETAQILKLVRKHEEKILQAWEETFTRGSNHG
jgi:hypothetical protein